MASKTWAVGEKVTAALTNTYLTHEGGAFTTWTPAITQGVSVTCTVQRATYYRSGRLIVADFVITATSSGTASNAISVTLPATAAYAGVPCGVGQVADASAGLNYLGTARVQTTTTVSFLSGTASDNRLGLSVMTAALASGDIIIASVHYEAATG